MQAYGIAVTVTFLALILAAGAAAAEKDEGTIGRLRRGLVSFGQLVWAKSLLAAVVGLALGAAIAILFGIVVEIGGVTGGEPWARLPLLFLGVALVGGVVGSVGVLLGALAREARTASLLAVLVVLPVVFLGIVPRGAVCGRVLDQPVPPVRPRRALVRRRPLRHRPVADDRVETLWLVGIGLAFGCWRGRVATAGGVANSWLRQATPSGVAKRNRSSQAGLASPNHVASPRHATFGARTLRT